MSSNTNLNQDRFIWSYPFFFYTLLTHYRKEENGVSDIAPWMAACFLTFWCGAIHLGVSLYLIGNCHPDYLSVNFFSKEYDWFNDVATYCLLFLPNALFFLIKKRYLVYEQHFDALPLKVKLRGKKLSWIVLYSGIAFAMLMMWWFTTSPC
jgi:uncharacterized membrane protein YbhN (UPF0104 family)